MVLIVEFGDTATVKRSYFSAMFRMGLLLSVTSGKLLVGLADGKQAHETG